LLENVFKAKEVGICGQGFYPHRNTGGTVLKIGPLTRLEDIDLTGSMLCSREVLKHMIPRRSGVIISIASEGGRGGDGRAGYPMRSPYCCAKMGIIGLTETLAVEVGEYNIRANCISPAAVKGERLINVVKGRAELRVSLLRSQ